MPAVPGVVFLEGARTPIGSFLGGLSRLTPTELGTRAALAALERSAVDGAEVDAVYFGNVIPSGKDSAYLARHVGIDAGCPIETPALNVNRACGSGMEALAQGAKALALGEATMVLAGGAENMSMTPYAMRGVREGWRMIRAQVDDMLFTTLHDPRAGCSIGETVEELAASCGVTRADADEAALWGQRRTAVAVESGVLDEEIVTVRHGGRHRPAVVERDESPRPDTTPEALAALRGLYATDGVVTAGNSTGLNDGAAAMVMTTAERASQGGVEPLGRLVSWGTVGIEPRRMGLGPVGAVRQALAHAELTLADMDVVELNDSFAVQFVAIERELGLDRERVNPNGGAVALGHPMGATGTRLVLTALYQLRRVGGRYALCTLCIGGGQGMAMVVARD